MKILLVESCAQTALPLIRHFEIEGQSVTAVGDSGSALSVARSEPHDLILIDLESWDNGIELCRSLRADRCQSGIFLVTADANREAMIAGLDAGADDCVLKPFEVDHLSARIRAFVRRNSGHVSNSILCGELAMDESSKLVTFRGEPIHLTPTEYRLLNWLMKHPNRTHQKDALIDKLYGREDRPSQSVIKAHIKGLRLKLMASGAPKNTISTIHGFGYRLKGN